MTHFKPLSKVLCIIGLSFCLVACQKQIPQDDLLYTASSDLELTSFLDQLNPMSQGLKSWQDLAPALQYSLDYVQQRNPDQVVIADAQQSITWAEVKQSLLTLQKLLPQLDQNKNLLLEHFQWYKLSQPAKFSGYYEPLLAASKVKTNEYQYPLYKLPPDLQTLELGKFNLELIGQKLSYRLQNNQPIPYYTRQEIDELGVLKNKNLELAWLKDPIDAYFLHVQGSGRLQYSDGTKQAIGYAGKNGYTYTSIGGYLSDQGFISPDKLSMQAIRAWLTENMTSLTQVLSQNKSYIFFHFPTQASTYPQGSLSRPLTPWVSLAVDRTTFPLGCLLAYQTKLPQPGGSKQLSALGFAQDTGSAIKENKLDLFCGQGAEAEFIAGHLNSSGQVWLMLAK